MIDYDSRAHIVGVRYPKRLRFVGLTTGHRTEIDKIWYTGNHGNFKSDPTIF